MDFGSNNMTAKPKVLAPKQAEDLSILPEICLEELEGMILSVYASPS